MHRLIDLIIGFFAAVGLIAASALVGLYLAGFFVYLHKVYPTIWVWGLLA